MGKTAPVPNCSDEDRSAIEKWARSSSEEARYVIRAKMILGCLEGKTVTEIAKFLHVRPNTVIFWRKRFTVQGIKGLRDRPRPGKPRQYGEEFRNQVLKVLEEEPPKGQAVWDGAALAKRLGASDDASGVFCVGKEYVCSDSGVGVLAPTRNLQLKPLM